MGRERWSWLVLMALLAAGGDARPAEDNTTEGLAQLAKEIGALRAAGKAPEAVPLAKRLAEAAPRVLGADALQTATYLKLAAQVYGDGGQRAQAEPLYQRSLAIREARLGKDHLEVANSLIFLGWHYYSIAQYAKAEPLFQRALQIREAKLGPDHLDVAWGLQNLVSVYLRQYQYAKAEPAARRALTIREAKLGKEHILVSGTLMSLAWIYSETGQYAKAEPFAVRSLAIREAKQGKDHYDLASSLNTLAWLYWRMREYDRAEPMARRHLALREARQIPHDQSLAESLEILAMVCEAGGRSAEAADLIDRARRINRGYVAQILPILSSQEQDAFLRRRDRNGYNQGLSLGLRHGADQGLAVRSAAWLLNGKALIQQTSAEAILLARDSRDPATADLSRRLAGTRRQLARLALALPPAGKEAEQRRQFRDLAGQEQELARQLQKAGSRSSSPDPWVEHGKLLRALPAGAALIDIARLNLFDSRATGPWPLGNSARYAAWVSRPGQPVQVLDLGPAQDIDAAIARVRQAIAAASKTIRQQGEPDAESALREPLEALAKLVLHPLLPHLGQSERWIISPDGNLWLVPWAALPLPDGKYAIEEHPITYVVSGRDLVNAPVGATVHPTAPLVLADPDFDLEPAEATRLSRALLRDLGASTSASLAGRTATGTLADFAVHVTFAAGGTLEVRAGDAQGQVIGKGTWSQEGTTVRAETEKSRYQGQLRGAQIVGRRQLKDGAQPPDAWILTLDRASKSLLAQADAQRSAQRLGRAPRLPGTAAEAEQITPALRKYAGQAPRVYQDKQALAPVVQASRSPRVLVLSTHGFFLPDQVVEPKERERLLADDKHRPIPGLENPLLRCGLLLAGANHADQAKEGEDTGVLTGLQIVGTDLRGTELVVLSACETGLGDVRNGEGVAGLRQAFQLAGAESVVATLWQVPDQQSAQLMIKFFDNLAAKRTKADALRNAQLELIKARRERNAAAHPFFWAAFTLTGS